MKEVTKSNLDNEQHPSVGNAFAIRLLPTEAILAFLDSRSVEL